MSSEVPSETEFPVWGLVPKKETSVVSFLNKYSNFDGRDTVIAIFDSGVDPAATGLKVTSTGETKVIERYDCSGCGDVDTSIIVSKIADDGSITGISGRKLMIPKSWKNPSGEWRIGIVHAYSLYPSKLKERVQEHRKQHLWDTKHKSAYAKANKELQDFESANASSSTLSPEQKALKEELECRVDILQNADKKFNDLGPTYDCVLYHDGQVWRACIDTTECGNLTEALVLGEYSITKEHHHLTSLDEMTVSVNVHDNGDILEIVGMCSTHGTHVASIAAGYFSDEPDKNGVAPGAKIVSLTIGDSRLGSMETGTALVRACIKVMELSKKMKIDVINMSYGEHAHWSNAGRVGDVICEVVNRYGVTWVVSAGNHGPALCTVGAPPDIIQPILIGVGAYVSVDMMRAAYSLRQKADPGAYSWSSRGPGADGAAGVTICAPGGAVASVARYTLRQSQLLNGTSMAAPHVAGAIGVLISGLKAKKLPYSPYSIKRSLENSATCLKHVEPWAQGSGLLNVEKAFELLCESHKEPERDVTFSILCGPTNSKGILLRPKKLDVPKDIAINIEPKFLQNHDDMEDTGLISKQIDFGMRLAFACSQSWVSYPSYLDMMNVSRQILVRIDLPSVPVGPNFAIILAYDTKNVEKGPVFKIPVTVLKCEDLDMETPGCPSLVKTNVPFQQSTIVRHFINVPIEATWAVLTMRTKDIDANGKFLIHTMQMLPKKSCRCHEYQKLVNLVAQHDTVLPFKVVSGLPIEVVIAKYWANIGTLSVDYTIEFHGIKPDFGNRLTFHGAEGLQPVLLTALRTEECQPNAVLKYSEPILRPSETKLSPLTLRDVIPPGRQIYQLINTYNFHVAKATEVSPNVALISDVLYESEIESQMWMIFNSCKQLMAVGDAYPNKYSIKLEKGDYVLRLNLRHEQKSLLEKFQDLPVLLQQKLPQAITLEVYNSHSQAVTGGKKFSGASISQGTMLPIYFAGVPSDKISRNNLSIGQLLTGQITFAKDEFGRKVDTYDIKYIIPEPPKKNSTSNNKNDKDKNKNDDYIEALKEFKTNWIGKLEGDKLDEVYGELKKSYPEYLAAHVAYINTLDPPADPKRLPRMNQKPDVTIELCKTIIEIADKVISNISMDKLLAYFGMKNDTRPNAAKIKTEQEKNRTVLIEALCRRGVSQCRLYALEKNIILLDDIVANMDNLLAFVDITDSKVIHYGVWYCFTLKHWGRTIKLLNKIQEDRASKEIDERLVELYNILGWNYYGTITENWLPIRYPTAYRIF